MDGKDYKPYTAKRWTEIPEPEIIGHTDFTEEEERENDRKAEEMLRKYGLLKPSQHIRNSEVVEDK